MIPSSKRAIRVVLQDTSTGLFYQGEGKWGPNAEKAYDFKAGHAAVDFCLKREIAAGQITLCFEDPQYNVRLKVSQMRWRAELDREAI